MEHLKNLEPDGGDDDHEDICGAFNVALNQDWQSKHRYAVLIADSPCHGHDYHEIYDNFPEGDPRGHVIEDQITRFAEKNIVFAALRIT